MPLTLVLGPANSAKAGEVLGAYATAARRGAVLVVPTVLDARHYTRELAGPGALLRAAPARWGEDQVFFYGFDELTALERDAVETLSRIAGADVTVSLTYEPGREALISRAEAVEELRPLSGRVLELPALPTHYHSDT